MREEPCGAPAVPAGMAGLVDGYRWARDAVGESGGAVYRLHGKPGAGDLFLKHGRGTVADDIADEFARLRWLAGRIAAPAVAGFVAAPDEAWLLTTAVEGRTAYQLLEADPGGGAAVVDALAAFLRTLHALPVDDCPFDSGHRVRMAHAARRIAAGLVEEDEFDAAREGWTAAQVWDAMQALLPLDADRVVTHGDYSLDNLILLDGRVVGCIDVGRVGVADRYQDLAILWNCLGEFDDALQARLWRAYGIAAPDPRRLDFHLMLDELF